MNQELSRFASDRLRALSERELSGFITDACLDSDGLGAIGVAVPDLRRQLHLERRHLLQCEVFSV